MVNTRLTSSMKGHQDHSIEVFLVLPKVRNLILMKKSYTRVIEDSVSRSFRKETTYQQTCRKVSRTRVSKMCLDCFKKDVNGPSIGLQSVTKR